MTVGLNLLCCLRFFLLRRDVSLFSILCMTTVSEAFSGDYSSYEAVHPVVEAAEQAGVDPVWAETLIGDAERQQSILDAIARPAEKTKPWHEYRNIFLTDRRIREGAVFWNEHAVALSNVAERTGVPEQVIVAIIGVETYYGRIMGSYRVIDALSTLAFDYPRRSAFFAKELEQFLILAWESGKDPYQLKGSYAGAMGYGQFMPSSYRAYAISINGSGAPDIWDNPEDAISSVGNYLRAHGWQGGEGVVVDAVTTADWSSVYSSRLKPSKTIAQLASEGIRPIETLASDIVATPIKLDEADGPRYWLGLQNFYVITRYNHSAMYAMAVWELSQAVALARSRS